LFGNGNDIDDTTSPMEAGLGWILGFTRLYLKIFFEAQRPWTREKLVGFQMEEKVTRHDYEIKGCGRTDY
jgi:glycine cleavage system aminomethyltransferase T